MDPIRCKCCDRPMLPMLEDKYFNQAGQLVTGTVYRCDDCDIDEMVEEVWEKVKTNRRYYFHG